MDILIAIRFIQNHTATDTNDEGQRSRIAVFHCTHLEGLIVVFRVDLEG